MHSKGKLLAVLAAATAVIGLGAAQAGAGSQRGAADMITIDIKPALKTQPVQKIQVPKPPAGTRIGFAHPILSEPGAGTVSAGAAKVAKLVGASYTVEDAALDVNKQLQIAESMLSRGFNGIITIDLFANSMNKFYAAADAKKVPNVTEYSNRPGAVGEDWKIPGRDAVAIILAKYPEGATGVMLSDTPAPVIVNREKGFRQAVAATGGKIKVVALQRNLKETLDGARAIAESLLTAHPDIQFVWGSNDTGAIGMALAAQAAGKKGLIITGMNGSPEGVDAVKKGLITATWDANQNGQGELLAINLLNWMATGKVAKAQNVPFTKIDKSNAAQYIPWSERAK